MMRLALAAISFSALIAALPAAAQDAEKPIDQFARCTVGADAAGARALLTLAPGSAESKNAAKRLADKKGACGSVIKRPGEPEVRGAIAERLYLDTYATPPAALTGEPAPFQGSGDATQAMYDVTRCAASRDPAAADMLIRAAAGTAEEKAALARVVPAVGRCTPQGAKLGFNRDQLHALVAEGLFKLRGETPAQ
ncbi:hypothetical protein IAG41_04065 [Sphingomonas sp. JC676]|uniref:hypothetical protein n=1 Tax=Sphingomonas sp. JC676 TaxID=2768065 RepID=UPI0016580552|nr:hypothetical protein [Sphingomonas sp. JC676]MBC9031560.1 hypothetical protein [Sphingomonas sp. JC676]